MKNRFCFRMLLLTSFFSLFASGSMAQKGEWQLGTDVYNRYVWRGMDFGNSPSIQPSLSYTNSGFTIGAWGAYATNVDYQETDIYVSYDIKEVVTLVVTDYFFPAGNVGNNAYFKYDEDVTGHIFEGSVIFNGMDNIPFSLSLNYNFYGADADNSFYAELGYGGIARDVEYNVFIGATNGKGIYLPDGSDQFSVVNLGLSLSKAITITEAFSLPFTASVITNPQAQNIFFVVGFSL